MYVTYIYAFAKSLCALTVISTMLQLDFEWQGEKLVVSVHNTQGFFGDHTIEYTVDEDDDLQQVIQELMYQQTICWTN